MATTYDPTKDPYTNFAAAPGLPGANGVLVVPSDTVDFVTYPKGLVLATAGSFTVLPVKAADDGSHLVTFTSAPCGFQVPFRVRRVMATGITTSVLIAITD